MTEQPQRPPSIARLARALRQRGRRISDSTLLALAIAVCVGGTAWSFVDYGHNVQIAPVAVVVMVFGSLVLGTLPMVVVIVVLAAGVVTIVVAHDQVSSQLTASGVVMLATVAWVSVVQTRRREALGLRRISAESVLERVRHRLRVQGAVPDLPLGWHVDVVQESAHRAAFAGDFVSVRVHQVDGVAYLDLALVDVSGSGIEAGSRALLLSGAVGGLLGAVPAAAFLDQANGYLRRQHWGSGFASASYLRLDLTSSGYEIRNAGHPPPLRWSEGERIAVRTVGSGTVLGVVDDLALRADAGTLRPGDALVLYTDGMIEDRSTDLDASISRLEHAVADGLSDATLDALAACLASSVRGSGHDDRTVVVVWNDGTSGPATRTTLADETVTTPPGTFSLARRGRGAR